MRHPHTHKSEPSQVTVKFEDGLHSFFLSEGATLTELADRIGAIGSEHNGAPISIDIEFGARRARSIDQSQLRSPLVH